MTTDNLINLSAAIIVGGGTLFLGIMAWRTIRQTRNLQRQQNRDKLLSEIADWAIDVSRCVSRPGDFLTFRESTKNVEDMKLYMSLAATNLQFDLVEIQNRGVYIISIATAFSKELQEDINNLMRDLKKYEDIIDKQAQRFSTAPDDLEEFNSILKDAGQEMGEAPLSGKTIAKVIVGVAKIRTTDIG